MSDTETQQGNTKWEDRLRSAFSEDLGVERFDLDAIVPAKRELKFDGTVYTIDAEVPLTLLDKLLEFESLMEKAEDGERQVAVLKQLQDEIRKYLLVHNSEVPEDLGLSTQRIPLVINYLMNGRTATESVIMTMSGGPLRELSETLAQIRAEAEEDGAVEPEPETPEVAPPLASEQLSTRRSSASRKSSTGRRRGGNKKTSARSGST